MNMAEPRAEGVRLQWNCEKFTAPIVEPLLK